MPTTLHRATLLVMLAACGCEAPSPAARRMELAAPAEAVAMITYHSPRRPLHSDRFELATGRFMPGDDGMGPEGDLDFFFDGARFYLATNQGGGARRALAPAGPAPTFSGAPVALHEGDAFLVQTPQGIGQLWITRLASGSLHLSPSAIGGEGEIAFRYSAP